MKKALFKIILPVCVLVLWMITCYQVCNKAEGFDYFLYWILVGCPYGIRKMCMFLVPKNFGIAGSMGILALNCKVAWMWRVSEGTNASDKMMAVMNRFDKLFANPLPSFHPRDLLIGVAGGIALRLVVYYKAKNAKKFRQGVEYGSARWGNAKDIEPYMDSVFENNVLLTQTERLMMSGRPKEPKYARNKNILVIGGSGSGKTRFFVKPNLMQMHSSYVVTDPKG